MALSSAPVAAIGAPSLRSWRALPWALALVAFAPVLLLRAEALTESDTFWETRAGLQILRDRALPGADSWSWTASGRPWTLNSWGFDVLLGAADRVAGLVGVAAAGLVLGALLLVLVLVLARRWGASAAVSGALLLLSAPLLIPWLAVRPQLVDYAAVLALVLLLERVLRRPVVRTLLMGGGLFLLWTNLHPGGILGIAVEVALAGIAAAVPTLRSRLPWLLGLIAVSAAVMPLNPYGWRVLMQASAVQQASAGLVAEWAPLDPAAPLQDLAVAAGLLGLVVSTGARRWALVAALAVTVVAGGLAVRILPVVVLLAVPAIAAAATPVVQRWIHDRSLVLGPAATLVVALVAGAALLQWGRFGQPSASLFPVGLIRELPVGCRLLNPYAMGGAVELLRPDVLVSVDSRNDLYGRALVEADERTVDGREPDVALLAGADCALLPASGPLAHRLENDGGWRLLDRAGTSVLLARRGR